MIPAGVVRTVVAIYGTVVQAGDASGVKIVEAPAVMETGEGPASCREAAAVEPATVLRERRRRADYYCHE